MDHSCHKCGQRIEDGKPFCPQCGAPQIRVAIPEVAAEPARVGDIASPALGHEIILESAGRPGPLPVRWYAASRPCALAAAIALLLLLLRVNPFVAAFGTGFLSVFFSRRQSPGTVTRAGAGARLGALSGVLFFAMVTVLEAAAVAVLHKGDEVRSQVIDKIQQAAARYPGPEVQPFLDFAKSPRGLAFMIGASLIFGLVAFLVLGGLGGALGAALLGRRNPP